MIDEMIIEKVLRTLTIKFDRIVVTIKEIKKFSEVKIEDLLSTLKGYDVTYIERNNGKEEECVPISTFKNNEVDKKK